MGLAGSIVSRQMPPDITQQARTRPASSLKSRKPATEHLAGLLATGWHFPERFSVKARDGVTDLYGSIVRPTNFDPVEAKKSVDRAVKDLTLHP